MGFNRGKLLPAMKKPIVGCIFLVLAGPGQRVRGNNNPKEYVTVTWLEGVVGRYPLLWVV